MANEKPLVSVIIPAYNREGSIEITLNSVVDNSYRPIEILVIDDGSTDSTEEIVKAYICTNSTSNQLIRYIYQKNGGACRARNNGLNNAVGQYLFFLDSDDVVEKFKIETQIQLLISNKADICVSDFTIRFQNDIMREDIYKSNKNPLKKVISNGSISCTSSLISSDLAKSVQWTEELPYFQDMDYFLKILLLARKVIYVPVSTFTYKRFNSDSITLANKRNPVPYYVRFKSLFNDGLLNFKYNKSISSRLVILYAMFRMFVSLQHNHIKK